jgi:hypothetical protein
LATVPWRCAVVVTAGLLGLAVLSLSIYHPCRITELGAPPRHGREVRLQLHTKNDPGCYYHSLFNRGAVTLHDDGKPMHVTSLFPFSDGCVWEADEVMTPLGDGRYHYQYRERPVSCRPDHEPAAACTRNGLVTETTY